MEFNCDSDLFLAQRLSTISLKEPRPNVKRKDTGTPSKNVASRGSKRSKKKSAKRKTEKRAESCPVLDKNCDTISYRIYGNPTGEGFLIEARMYKGNEGRNERRKKDRQTMYTVYIHEKTGENS